MREQRKRKALYANRREELYPAALLQKEYGQPRRRRAPAPAPKVAPKTPKRRQP